MNKPQSIEDILDMAGFQIYPHEANIKRTEAKAAIEAMIRDIIGQDEMSLVMSPRYMKTDSTGRVDNTWTSEDDAYREAHIKTSLQIQQRLRASKYNLKLEKE